MTFPDGTTKEKIHEAGNTEWLEPQRHAGENPGDTPVIIIAVISKPAR